MFAYFFSTIPICFPSTYPTDLFRSPTIPHLHLRTLIMCLNRQITLAIGDEIRDSSALADTMNNSFDNTRVRLRGTMNRMLRMAERTGVGWRVWIIFFAAVTVLFWYVWLF